VGYAIANREIIDSMLIIHQHAVSCPSSFAQKAAVTALNGSQETVKEMIRKFTERRDYILEEIREIDRISFMKPRGTFHIFPNVSKYGKLSQELAELLLEETKVATVPGISFGNNGEGHLRISFTNSREYIRKGVDRIKSFLKTV
jgi:aspartate/methionine/tyrosine aminotransferase